MLKEYPVTKSICVWSVSVKICQNTCWTQAKEQRLHLLYKTRNTVFAKIDSYSLQQSKESTTTWDRRKILCSELPHYSIQIPSFQQQIKRHTKNRKVLHAKNKNIWQKPARRKPRHQIYQSIAFFNWLKYAKKAKGKCRKLKETRKII